MFRRCHRLTLALCSCLLLSFSWSAHVYAQTDAQAALQQAREAFEAEQFELARNQARVASQTDAQNPDVWLLLGKAHFQLGELDQALSAWRTVLQLAPSHEYAQRMVETLSGQISDVDVRIRLAAVMVADGFLKTARGELQTLRAQTALTSEQLQRVLLLLAETAVLEGQGTESLALLSEVASRNPDARDEISVRLLRARAQVATGGEFAALGLAELSKLATETPESPEGAVARLELLLFRLAQGEDAVAPTAAWLEQHGSLPAARRGRLALRESVQQFVATSAQLPPPSSDAPLNDHDRAALAAAALALPVFIDPADQLALAEPLASHFERRYATAHAYAAAGIGLETMNTWQLSPAAALIVAQTRERVNQAQATYELTLIRRDVDGGTQGPEALAQWIQNHKGHPQEREARRSLVLAYLAASRRLAAPTPDAQLADADTQAIEAAGELIPQLQDQAEATQLIEVLTQHFQRHYFDRGAHSAAIAGVTRLVPLASAPGRYQVLHVLLNLQRQAALAELQAQVTAGTVPRQTAPLPPLLQAAAATADRIGAEFPATPAWRIRAEFAGQVLDVAEKVAWPTKIESLKAAHGWALELALPVAQAPPDGDSHQLARQVVERVIAAVAAMAQPATSQLAIDTHDRLLSLIPAAGEHWGSVALRHVDLLSAEAARTFQDHLQRGADAENARLSPTQQQILELLAKLVQQRPSEAEAAFQKLSQHLQPWLDARHDQVVESAWEALAADLPPATQRTVRLTLARLWFGQVRREYARTTALGFQVPRALDDRATKTLEACYRLAAQLGPDDSLLPEVHAVRRQVIDHYMQLNYDEVAEAAIRVKIEPAQTLLDELAELELADLRQHVAARQLQRQLEHHGAKKQIALTPTYREAIAALKKFITDHPASIHVPAAAAKVLAIGRQFEQHEAWQVAAEIYLDFEQFASQVESLRQALPGQMTYPEQAAVARATALHQRASLALREQQAAQPSDAPPPTQWSSEFQAADAAWKAIIADYQQRPVAQLALRRIMDIAHEYAALNAWDVADTVYSGLLGLELPLQAPERLEFGRAICQLGKVLPDHARTVLAALTLTSSPAGRDSGPEGPASGLASGTLSEEMIPGLEGVLSDFRYAGPSRENEALANSSTPATEPVPAAEPAPPATDPFGAGGESTGGAAGSGGFGGGSVGGGRRFSQRADADAQLLAAVRAQLDRQAQQVAMLRDEAITRTLRSNKPDYAEQDATKKLPSQSAQEVTVLSEAELQRQQQVLDAVYAALQELRNKYAQSPTAAQARDEILAIVNHWRTIAQWDRAALLASRYLADNPTDLGLPQIRQEVARDWLAWAALGLRDSELAREDLLAEISRRFTTARDELQAIIEAFPENMEARHAAQWDIANSFLTQARVVAASSPTLARGQFVRAATELLRVAELFHDHPQIGTIPDMLWSISEELASRGYHDEAISVWNELRIHYPVHALAEQSALRIAQTWQQLGQPLRAVEGYLELNFAGGGTEAELQTAIYQIAVALKDQKRWIESLHVLQTFVDSFPTHADAGQALTLIGHIHQANEAWNEAIAAYGRVIDEFPTGAWTIEARWSIAECTINLSRWQQAIGAYAEFQASYAEDARVAEAARRIEVLKTLSRYQDVVDEEGQPKAFDAQFQIAAIVHAQLTNPVKAVIEYRKVAQNWPTSHLADDALFEIGKLYLERGETEAARTALLEAAVSYPESPLADDALLLVGQSFVSEADRLAAVDRGKSQEIAKDIAQRQAYQFAQDNRRRQLEKNIDQVAQLKRQGLDEEAENKEAYLAGQALQFDAANTINLSTWAAQQEEVLSAAQLADRQDKINAALRKAVDVFRRAASVTSADKADDALLQMAQIYDERLKDSSAAMATWEEIVKQYSGTTVAEDASWKIASFYESQQDHEKAITAYQTFFRNYRRSPRAGQAQAAIAENYEHLGQWVQAMDAYTNYLNNFPDGPLVTKARDQINWIKTYRL